MALAYKVDKLELEKPYYFCNSYTTMQLYEKLDPPYVSEYTEEGPMKGMKVKMYCDLASTLKASVFAAGAYMMASTF